MTEIIKRKKALSVSPLKTSQTSGGALAFLGVARSVRSGPGPDNPGRHPSVRHP
ncbi:MAG TPA: hypothetical protein PK129_06660 [Cellvibrionaceae bacterium]|nr:hypothetical protein [Cellvibrionaceae bacterium]